MIKKEGGTMVRDTIFLYVMAVIASCFGLINCIQFFFKGNKTARPSNPNLRSRIEEAVKNIK